MYDGKVHSAYYPRYGAGYVTRLQSVVNGEMVIYQDFHMQKDRLTAPGTVVKAGDIIGYQGDSGNLQAAIRSGGVDSHVHIKFSKYNGNGDYNNYNNYIETDPVTYFGSTFTETGTSNNDCN